MDRDRMADRQVLNAEQLTSPEADDPLAVVVTQSISGQPTDRELLTEDKLCWLYTRSNGSAHHPTHRHIIYSR